jgi:clan AA aspartic protease (TIGR02281 family)
MIARGIGYVVGRVGIVKTAVFVTAAGVAVAYGPDILGHVPALGHAWARLEQFVPRLPPSLMPSAVWREVSGRIAHLVPPAERQPERQPEPGSRAPAQRSKPDAAPADRPGRLVVPVNENNACLVTAWLNGMPADFLLDSGSYSVALSRQTAAALGIDTARLVYDRKIGTAGGTSWAARITLRELRVGKRVFPNVPADIIEGKRNLLGMPILLQVGFRVTDGSCELG